MKILLLRPFFSVEKFYFPRFINEPLGLEYLASYLKKDHQVKIIDGVAEAYNKYRLNKTDKNIIYQGLELEEIIKKVNQYNPNIIGITWLFSTQNDCINSTAQTIKQARPEIPIIVGGPHPSTNPKQVLKENQHIDIVVYGEGEITLKELLDKKLKDLENIKGIAFRDSDSRIKINPPRPLIEDLDQLPLPDRDSTPYQNYNKQNLYAFLYNRLKKLPIRAKQNEELSAQISQLPFLDKLYFTLHNKKQKHELLPKADVVTSRGCPNRCTFCAVHNIWRYQMRIRSHKNVLEEIDILVNRYKIKHINIQDDNFNISKERTIEICKGLISRKYNLSLTANSGIYFPSLDKEILVLLKKAGFNLLRMSIESGNQNTLNNIIKKKIDLYKVKEIVKLCRELKIITEGAFIFGLPGETIKTMQDTLNFAKTANFDYIKKFIFQPFPNTELYDICVKNNYLTKDYNPQKIYVTNKQCYIKTEQFSPKDVIRIIQKS